MRLELRHLTAILIVAGVMDLPRDDRCHCRDHAETSRANS